MPTRRRPRATTIALSLLVLASAALFVLARSGLGVDGAVVRRIEASDLPPPREGTGAAGPMSASDPWAVPDHVPAPPMRYVRFETFGREDGLPSDKTTAVLPVGEDLWVGTDAGLALRRDGRWRTWTERDGLANRYVTSLSHDQETGALWISTLRGLSRLSGEEITTWRQTDSGLLNDVVYHVVADGPLVWAATAAGTSVLDLRTDAWALYDHGNSIMHEPWCYALAVAPGRTWVGVWGGGVVELDRAAGRWREYRDPDGEMEIDLLRDDGPIHDVTSFVAYDDGVLWQSTYFGLARYDGRRWRSFLSKDSGLPGDFINHVAAVGHTAYVSTDQGFAVFDGTTWVSYRRQEDGRCAVRVVRAGAEVERATLPTAPADDYVLWAHGDATGVWLATGRGLSHGAIR